MAAPKRSACSLCPVLFVTVLVLFLYLVFLILTLIPMIQDPKTQQIGIILTSVFHAFFLLFAASAFGASMITPGHIPDQPPWLAQVYDANGEPVFFEGENSQLVTYGLETQERKRDGNRRICRKCNLFKPDRSHHCSVCQKCVLKMDHHCPWINNCVGYFNHKHFLLFLIYATICSAFLVGGMALRLKNALHPVWDVGHFMRTDFLVILAYFLNALLFIALSLFTGFHIYLVLSGTTTIEYCEKKRGTPEKQVRFDKEHQKFNHGLYGNFKHVFGVNPLLWCIPTIAGTHHPSFFSHDGTYRFRAIARQPNQEAYIQTPPNVSSAQSAAPATRQPQIQTKRKSRKSTSAPSASAGSGASSAAAPVASSSGGNGAHAIV